MTQWVYLSRIIHYQSMTVAPNEVYLNLTRLPYKSFIPLELYTCITTINVNAFYGDMI